MGSTFYVSKESKDKQGKSRGAWRYECKERKIIDTFNAKFSREWSRIREAGITQSVSDLITQLIELHEKQELKSGFTVSEYAEKYITFKTTRYRREPHVTESKIKAHEYRQHHYLKHFVNRYGRKRIEDITMEDAESYYNERMSAPPERGNKPLTHNVILLELTYVSSMFNHAIKYGHLKSVNPIRQAEFHKADNHRKRVLTPQEEERLLKHCDGDLFDIVILLLNTGMRKEELLSAEWSWIDTKKRLLNLPAHATKARKARDVRLNDDSIKIINKRKFVTKGAKYLFPSEYVTSKKGHKTFFFNVWKTALKNAEIEDLTFHDLRRTHATKLMELGTHLTVIRDALGHADSKTTERYINAKDGVMEAVDLLSSTDFLLRNEEKSSEKSS